jgi:hypothetical protein
MRVGILTVLLTLGCSAALVGAQAKTDGKTPRIMRIETVADAVTLLGHNDLDSRKRAIEWCKVRFAPSPARGEVRQGQEVKQVLRPLIASKRWDEVDDLANFILQNLVTDFRALEAAMAARVRVLQAQNQTAEALAAAKSYFNICSMESTADAILLVAECLIPARPDDRLAYEKFKEEQVAGASTQPATQPRRSSMLNGIKVDPKVYDELLKQYPGEDYGSLLARGNLHLLADRPQLAKPIFERMYALATPGYLPEASECIARCMKAEDGTIGRANAWVLSIRPKKTGP